MSYAHRLWGYARTPTSYLCVRTLCDFPQVILCPSSDPPKEQLLSHPAPEHHAHAVKELLSCIKVLFPGQVLGIAKPLATGDDGHLQDRTGL